MTIIMMLSDLTHTPCKAPEVPLLKKMALLSTPIAHIMTRKVVSVHGSQKLVDVKHIFEKKEFHHHIPVIENNELKGMISLIDFLHAIKEATLDDNDPVYHNQTVKDIMTGSPVTIPYTATLRDACKILEKGEVHALVACDNKKVKGILSTTDIITYLLMEDASDETN